MKIGFFSAALLTSSIANAAIPINGWYATVFGGYSYLPNNLSVTHNGYAYSHDAFNSGYNAGGSFGYKSNPLRYEGEFVYINAKVSGFNVNNISQNNVGGSASVPAVMANIYYDFPEFIRSVEPFLGFGIGYSWVSTSFTSQGPLGNISYNPSNTVFTYQGTGGLTFNYNEHFSLDLAYRYFATDKVGNLGKIFQANLVSVRATYRFDESRYK